MCLHDVKRRHNRCRAACCRAVLACLRRILGRRSAPGGTHKGAAGRTCARSEQLSQLGGWHGASSRAGLPSPHRPPAASCPLTSTTPGQAVGPTADSVSHNRPLDDKDASLTGTGPVSRLPSCSTQSRQRLPSVVARSCRLLSHRNKAIPAQPSSFCVNGR